mmetsp:Transcript_27837/g.67598  ORF Transcript_27837/g.67598 Transcript_27837/m.67598 type:complete len:267 (-) Transcript_27837:232-1032(-)
MYARQKLRSADASSDRYVLLAKPRSPARPPVARTHASNTWSKRSPMADAGCTSDADMMAPELMYGLCGRPSAFSTRSLKPRPDGSRPTWRCTLSSPCCSSASAYVSTFEHDWMQNCVRASPCVNCCPSTVHAAMPNCSASTRASCGMYDATAPLVSPRTSSNTARSSVVKSSNAGNTRRRSSARCSVTECAAAATRSAAPSTPPLASARACSTAMASATSAFVASRPSRSSCRSSCSYDTLTRAPPPPPSPWPPRQCRSRSALRRA